MPQSDFDFLPNATGFVTPLGGLDGQPVENAALSSPLLLEGTFAREYKWTAGNSTIAATLNAALNDGIWQPVGLAHAFNMYAAVRFGSAGTTNKAIGVSVKTGEIGSNPSFPNIASGYHLFLGRWNDGSVIHGVEEGLTLLMVDENANGFQARSVVVRTGFPNDEWHLIRLQVTPSGTGDSGSGASIPGAGAAPDTIRVTGLARMVPSDVGRYLTISDSDVNDGVFLITAYTSATEVEVLSPSGTFPDANNGSIEWQKSTQDILRVYSGVRNAGAFASIIAGAPAGQMRVSGLSGLTSASPGRLLTITGAASAGNNGSFPIVQNSDVEADVTNGAAVIPDAANGNIIWNEPLIWTLEHIETIDREIHSYYCDWGDATSDRMGFIAHNSAGANGSVYIDGFNAEREPLQTPTSHWTLDDDDISGGTTALDIVGPNDGTIVGATTGAAGQVGEAFTFDGSNDYLNLGTGPLDFNGSFSVAAWVFLDALGGFRRIIQNRGTGANGTQDGWYFRIDSAGEVLFAVEDGGVFDTATVGGTVSASTWTHVAASFDTTTGTKKVYQDGVLLLTSTTGGLVGADFTSGRESIIGASKVGATIDQVWDGRLDEILVFQDTILTDDFVSALYKLGLAGAQL